MAGSLSNIANNLSEEIHEIRCKYGRDDKKHETCRIKYKYCHCFLEYKYFKDDLIEYKCLCCFKSYQQKFDEKLKERVFNTYKVSNHYHLFKFIYNLFKDEFILLLLKGVYPNGYMEYWETSNETLPEKEDFCSHLDMEDITDADYVHPKNVCKDFEIKNFGEYHDFYVQSDTLLLANVFENFRNMCLKIYELDFAHFLSAPLLAWQAALKKTRVKSDLLIDIDMLFM